MGYDIPVENNLSDEERLEESKRLEAERNFELWYESPEYIPFYDRSRNEREIMIDEDDEDEYIEYILGDAIDDNYYDLHDKWMNRRRN
jgi:hypothetical protein